MLPSQLEEAISKNTKLVLINSPSNPTGSVYSRDELKELAKVLLSHPNVLIGTDDIYEKINLNGDPFYNIVMVEPRLKDRANYPKWCFESLFYDWVENWIRSRTFIYY